MSDYLYIIFQETSERASEKTLSVYYRRREYKATSSSSGSLDERIRWRTFHREHRRIRHFVEGLRG